jgi:DnaJ-class molecular chaperone
VIIPCQPCEGRGHTVNPAGQREDCPRCNGRGYLGSTEMSAEEIRDWWSKQKNGIPESGLSDGGKD